MNIRDLEQDLPSFWTDGQYPERFNSEPLPHRHFSHAMAHAMKALGGLAAYSDALDHNYMDKHGNADPEADAFRENAEKWLADLVICASRMAAKLPMPISLDESVAKRVAQIQARWASK